VLQLEIPARFDYSMMSSDVATAMWIMEFFCITSLMVRTSPPFRKQPVHDHAMCTCRCRYRF
jgi:hypothetical protein